MKDFIIISPDGFTYTKNDFEVNNHQVLSFQKAINEKEALKQFFKENEVLIKNREYENFIVFEISNKLELDISSLKRRLK